MLINVYGTNKTYEAIDFSEYLRSTLLERGPGQPSNEGEFVVLHSCSNDRIIRSVHKVFDIKVYYSNDSMDLNELIYNFYVVIVRCRAFGMQVM